MNFKRATTKIRLNIQIIDFIILDTNQTSIIVDIK